MTVNEMITIGIACFNAEDTILRAIKSALTQTWDNTEILIVDDASNDNSKSVVKAFIGNHTNIRLVEHEVNQGPGAVRQTILDNARGEFIAFFDDDDESLPQRVESQRARIVSYEELSDQKLIACYASGKRIYENGYEVKLDAIGSRDEIPIGKKLADRLLFFGGDPKCFYGTGAPSCSLMARRSTFIDIGGFDKSFRRIEDIDFAVRLALSGGHFIGCQEQLFLQYATQATDKAPSKNRDAELQLVEKYKDYLDSQGRYFYSKKWPLLRYHHFEKQYFQMLIVLVQLTVRHPIKTMSHFFTTAPKRVLHEFKMKERL